VTDDEVAGGLDTGDRGLLLAAVLLVPLSCFALSAVVLLLWSGRGLPVRYRALWVAMASAFAVFAWLLTFGRA